MSLRERVLVILFVMFSGYIAVEYSVHRWMIYPEYVRQEQQLAQSTVEHTVNIIENAFGDFQQQIAQSGQSGTFYDILQQKQTPASDTGPACDFILLFDYRWTLGWNNQLDENLSSLIQHELFDADSPFLTQDKMGFSKKCIYPINGQYAWVVAEPILSSPSSHTVEGMVIAGNYLNSTQFQAIKNRFELNFNWQIISPDGPTGETAEIARSLTTEKACHFSTLSENLIQCGTFLRDHQNRPAAFVKTFQNRNLSSEGLHSIYQLLLVKLAAGFAAGLFLILLLQHTVISPILKLIEHIEKTGNPTSTKEKIDFARNDEIGTLAREFDHMCSRVQDAQVKLVEKSYYSGITEMSSGILHNVRNALSPITTRIDRIKDQFQDIPLQHLEQAHLELQNGALSPERRTDLVRFVELTFQNVVTNLKETVTGLEDLSKQVFQIEDMLNGQKTFGGKEKGGPVEYIEPIQLIDKALGMVPEKTRKLCKVKTPSIKKLPAIPIHTATFTQVLQNLLVNAGESLDRVKSLYSKITVTCSIEADYPVNMLHWKIEDNGSGIEPEKIKTIFERGASSKKAGLTGIGLHWCANTITAMKGKIWAESDGPDRGACFHILIPMAAEETLTATKEG